MRILRCAELPPRLFEAGRPSVPGLAARLPQPLRCSIVRLRQGWSRRAEAPSRASRLAPRAERIQRSASAPCGKVAGRHSAAASHLAALHPAQPHCGRAAPLRNRSRAGAGRLQGRLTGPDSGGAGQLGLPSRPRPQRPADWAPGTGGGRRQWTLSRGGSTGGGAAQAGAAADEAAKSRRHGVRHARPSEATQYQALALRAHPCR